MHFTLNVQNNKKYFIFSFLIILAVLQTSKNYIILPFKYTNISLKDIDKREKNPIEKFLSLMNNNKIYTSISFGSPYQSIDFYFSMNQYPTSINQNTCLINSISSYNPQKSTNLKIIHNGFYSDKCTVYNNLNLTENITIDVFNFYSNENLNNIDLIENNKFCGVFGLSRYPNNAENNSKSFIHNLKKNNYINSYSFGFFFFDDIKIYNDEDEIQEYYDGFFMAGLSFADDLDIIDNNLLFTIYAEEDTLNWAIYFERIFYYEKINNSVEYIYTNNTKVEFIIDLNYIVSDEQYYEDIKKIYFKKYFDNNTCYEEKLIKKGKYIKMIICDIKFKEYKKSFPGIFFYNERLFFAFNFYDNDLFYEYDNKIYFMVIRKEEIKTHWQLGKIFLKKYPLMFDYDKKIVSFIKLKKPWNIKKNIKKNQQSNNHDNINREYLIYILLILGIFIGILIGKRIWNKKNKLKANELEDQYKYIEDPNIKNKNAILNY